MLDIFSTPDEFKAHRKRLDSYWSQKLVDCRKALSRLPGYCHTHSVVHGPFSKVREPDTCQLVV